MNYKLSVFISSTSDLKQWRNAATKALSELNIDGSKFEEWPSSPNAPIEECLLNIIESDAFILLLGKNYGSPKHLKLSATHLEYRQANKHNKPIFAYLLKSMEREPEQVAFIKEIEQSKFHCKPIKSIKHLKEEVKTSITKEFTRCFRQVHSPPGKIPSIFPIEQDLLDIVLSENPQKACRQLTRLYEAGNDLTIHKMADDCERNFTIYPNIMNVIYMAETNMGINGYSVDLERLERAVEFWGSEEAKRRWVNYSLKYNQGNALLASKCFSDSIEKYKQALNEKPDFAKCWKNLGAAYLEMADIDSAFECYETALKYNPQLFEALLSIAMLFVKEKHAPEESLKYFNQIITSNLPSDRLALVNGWKAYVNLELGNYAEGIANAENAIANDKEATWAWAIAGRLYALIRVQNQRWLEPSRKFWERFIDRFPDNPQAWAELGFIYWFLRDFKDKENLSQKALFAFKKSVEMDHEDNGLVWDRIGHLYQENEYWNEAEQAYRKAAEKGPKEFGYCL